MAERQRSGVARVVPEPDDGLLGVLVGELRARLAVTS